MHESQLVIPTITAEDILQMSNPSDSDTPYQATQLEMLNKVLQMEHQTEEWKSQKSGEYLVHFKKVESKRYMSKTGTTLNIPMEDLFQHIDETRFNTSPNIVREGFDVIHEFTPQLKIMHIKFKMSMLDRRDMVVLTYAEMFQSEDFAILVTKSIKRDDVPEEKDFKRIEIFAGYLIRRLSQNVCHVTVMYLADLKGSATKIPSVMKTSILTHAATVLGRVKAHFDNPSQ